MVLNSLYYLERFPCWDSSISPWATDLAYFAVCGLFRFNPSPSPASFGGAVDAGGAEGSSASSSSARNRRQAGARRGGGTRRVASGVLMAKVIEVSPWDSLAAAIGGVRATRTCLLFCSGVLCRIAIALRASRAFSFLPVISISVKPRVLALPYVFFF
jgi:hypothetical protein